MSSHASQYDDDDDSYRPRGHHRSPPRRSRDYSPDYHSGGSRMSGAIPAPSIVPIAPYDGPTPFYPPPSPRARPSNSLQVPYSSTRPRSQPPLSRDRDRDRSRDGRARDDRRGSNRSREKDRDRSPDSEDDHERPRSPLGKAKHIMQHTFSDSTSGLGVGVMGAIIGGLAAREASEAASRKSHSGHGRKGSDANQGAALLSTIVGAAVGGLGANALEKRIEKSKKNTKDEQGRWERKWGKEGVVDGGGRGKDRSRESEKRERRERERAVDMEEGRAVGRGRGYDDDDSEPDYVYDRRPRRRRSEEEMRYRS